ncbi:MAG: hypothetical protein RIS84_906 [Pseudomonadota bacterium]|jgi:hypothetical protein
MNYVVWGGEKSIELENQNDNLSMLLFWRGYTEHSPRAKDMLKASAYFLSLLEPVDQKTTKQMQFTMSLYLV